MTFYPKIGTVEVSLASGAIMKLPCCTICRKPEISRKDEEKLRREAVQLGRCRCTKRQKAAAR